MIFGFNTDVPGKDAVYHVQTEDRGIKNPIIDSIIYVGGKIVDRLRTAYVPQEVTPAQVEEMVRKQHKDLVESIRSGTFEPSGKHLPSTVSTPRGYAVRLVNPAEISRGDQLVFELSVWNRAQGTPGEDVSLEARWVQAGAVSQKTALQTAEDGLAVLSFPLPEDDTEAVLLIAANGPEGRELVKFRVHSMPR